MGRLLLGAAMLALTAAVHATQGSGAPQAPGPLHQHSSIDYLERPTTEAVARLNDALARGTTSLHRDQGTGYLRAVLDALDVPVESQLLLFSKTGIQREYTSPRNPRALYFNESVAVGYIPGAPSLEVAAHDPDQGVVFYTLDQAATTPTFARQTNCLACHVSSSTLEVPGLIARSNAVTADGSVMPRLDSHDVDHRTPHADRWGGWFVTGNAAAPPYGPLGHAGNLTVAVHPTAGPAIVSDRIFIEWLGSDPEEHGYLSRDSDLAALLVFDHQVRAINLLTRLNWDWRVASAAGTADGSNPSLAARVNELVDYLLMVGEAPPVTPISPRPGFAEHLARRVPKDRRGRTLAQLDLETRLLRYPCSYMVYAEAFDALPLPARQAVYRRMFALLSDRNKDPDYRHLSRADRRSIREILRETKTDLQASIR